MFYVGINSDGKIIHNFAIQNIHKEDNSSNIRSSYVWTDIIPARHQFSVVALTSKGPGEAATLMLSTLPDNSKLKVLFIYTMQSLFVANL